MAKLQIMISSDSFSKQLERTAIDSNLLLSKIPSNYLQIKKNLDQLYHITKKRNAKIPHYSQIALSSK